MKALLSSKWFLFCLTIVAAACIGCASTGDVRQQQPEPDEAAEQLSEAVTDPNASPVIQDITVMEEYDACNIHIVSSAPPNFTVFKLSGPDRIIVDLPSTHTAETCSVPTVTDSRFIRALTTSVLPEQDRSYLRIAIEMKGDFSYDATTNGNTIQVRLAQQGAVSAETSPETTAPQDDAAVTTAVPVPSSSPTITGIRVSTSDNTDTITIASDSAIEKYHSYSLQNPNRLVLDFPHVHSGVRNRLLTEQNPCIESIRTAENTDGTRIVVDLSGTEFPEYQIAQTGRLVTVDVSSPAAAAAAAEELQDNTDAAETAADDEVEAAETEAYSGEKISLDFKDADIKNVLRLIADISGLNMLVSDSVGGKVTLKLDNIPWDEAFDLILETNGLGKIETKNITRIETREQIQKINAEKLKAKKSQEEIEDLIVKTYDISYAKARDLSAFIKQMNVLSPRGSVNDFTLTNKLTVQDIASNFPKIEKMITEQDIPTRQVMIEARIVQSNPSYVKELGIKWGGTYSTSQNGDPITLGGAAGGGGAAAGQGTSIVNLPAPAGEGSGGAINFGYITNNLNLDVQLTALENEDKIKIISNPRILGLDNQVAKIKQGVALPYLKLSEEGVTSTEFKDAVLELEVMPKITPANTITLDLKVTKNQKSSQTGAGNEPGIDVREVETTLLLQSGITAVIGGIYENQKTVNIKKVPFFAELPLLGRAFKNEREEDILTELLVFITVTIVDIDESKKTIAQQTADTAS